MLSGVGLHTYHNEIGMAVPTNVIPLDADIATATCFENLFMLQHIGYDSRLHRDVGFVYQSRVLIQLQVLCSVV